MYEHTFPIHHQEYPVSARTPPRFFAGPTTDCGTGRFAERSRPIHITAAFVKYPDWASCFADRMATLQRLASVYPHYKHALDAGSATTYIHEVSQTWSTDPERAEKVLAIYDNIAGDWSATQN